LTYRIVADHLGSVRLVVRVTDGAVLQRLAYDEFGRELANTNPGFQPFGYAGGLADQHSGLVRFGARDYEPRSGRWTAKDPITFGAQGTNLYAYVSNDPINSIDPSGLCETSNCGPVPQGPPGADIDANMLEAWKHGTQMDPKWFYNQVKNKGPWDYKQVDPTVQSYKDFGNFNYGATGKAFGFDQRTLLREAGRAQIAAKTSQPGWGEPGARLNPFGGTPPFGDDPADQIIIKKGIAYYLCKQWEQARKLW